ncbi:MAG: hypothetical protein ACRDDY_03285 [Clostridium sp.]|uniref:hypothetical protein n=1 Tax=Clostridium sp. TaxID=1506 RepID=UPI003EE571CA
MNKQEFLDAMKEMEKVYGLPEILRYKGWEVDHYRGVASIYGFEVNENRFEIVLNFHKSTLRMSESYGDILSRKYVGCHFDRELIKDYDKFLEFLYEQVKPLLKK